MAHLSSSSYRKSGSGGGLVRTLDLGVSIIAVSIQNPGRYPEKANVNSEVVFYENRLNYKEHSEQIVQLCVMYQM